jgi:asparagine synthase (glutamine-hydrolysing)
MCGILGFVSSPSDRNGRAIAILHDMIAAVAHRGPDASGLWRDPTGRVNLGHRRLSIIDLSPGGAQPMKTRDGCGVIIYNGELYNFLELKAELAAEGIGFSSRSDTEVLLAALYHWGPARTLPKLNGMFAFAYWDGRSNSLVLARDRIGEKPLYYACQAGALYFGSELKALRAHPDYRAEINRAVLPLFFRFNYVPAPQTIYEDTWKLPAGHWVKFDIVSGRLGVPTPFWSMADMVRGAAAEQLSGSTEELVDEAERLLRRSVEMRMISDRPVGCFLSGGIDSSTVAALMQTVSNQRIQTFTIGYGEANLNEAEDAERVARHLGVAHTTFIVQAPDAQEMIPEMADIYDEPYADPSQIPTCLLSRLTARHVTVALTGDGGDEVFGGYNRYLWAREVWSRMQAFSPGIRKLIVQGIHKISPGVWDQLSRLFRPLLPRSFRVRSPGDKLHKIAYLAQAKDERDLYLRLTSLVHDPEEYGLAASAQPLPFDGLTPPEVLMRTEERMMFWDTLTYLPDDILVKLDRAAMRFGLEGRIPFLDNDVLRFAWQLPFREKVGPREGKLIIRKVLERYVPRSLFDRPKTGFGIPISDWLRGPLREWAQDLLANPVLKEYVHMAPTQELWRQHQSSQRNNDFRLWSVLMFSSWLRRWHGLGSGGEATPSSLIGDVRYILSKRGPSKGRIVFLINSLGAAGAEKQVVLSAITLAKHGYSSEIFTLQLDKRNARIESLLQTARLAGVYVHKPMAGANWFMSSLIACRKSLKRDHRSVLWTWGYRADLVATTLLKIRVPRISSLRSASAVMKARATWWRWFDSSCARYISNTWLNVEQLAEIIPSATRRSRVLYNAIEEEALKQAPVALPDSVNYLEIVMLGNLRVKVKGYDLAVEMIRRLRVEGRHVRLRIAGLPHEKKELDTCISEAKVGDVCEFIGPVADPFEFLRSAHVFLLFSRYEGMPNALLEAMALGLPCISTKVGDVPRFTRDREHLWQIDVNDVEAACEAIRNAQDNWPAFRKMGAAAYALIRREFSTDTFEAKLLESVAGLIPEPVIKCFPNKRSTKQT